MEGLITFVVEHPGSAVTVVALSLACLFGWLLFGSFKKQVEDIQKYHDNFGDRFELMKSSVERDLSITRTALTNHREDMGKATKAINGDMLKIKENIFELKRELLVKVDEAQLQVANLEREARALAHVLELTTEKFEAKFGKIIQFKEELAAAHGKIIRLEESQGAFKIDIVKHQQWFGEVGKALKAQKAELDALRAAQKKGSHEV